MLPQVSSQFDMTFLALHFDADTDSAIRSVASSIAAGCSAFGPQSSAFHVPLIGSLHNYTQDEVQQQSGLEAPICGRFVCWEVHANNLRVAVELDPVGAHELSQRLSTAFPLGRPWQRLYTVIGSVAAIDVAERDAFVQALQATFPISASQTFLCHSALQLHGTESTPSRQPKTASIDDIIKQARKQPRGVSNSKHPGRVHSPHRAWVKGQHTAHCEDITMRPVASVSHGSIRKKKAKKRSTANDNVTRQTITLPPTSATGRVVVVRPGPA